MLNKKIIIWDNDGTIMGSKDPHDTTSSAKFILPNVEHVMKTTDALHVICSGGKTHEDSRYYHLIGQFKKPGAGMLIVIKDMVLEEFCLTITPHNSLMIGDTWHDEHAAATMDVPFLDATHVHAINRYT